MTRVTCSSFIVIISIAYAIFDTARLLMIRNPWGSEQYGGNWSDGHELWTDERIAQIRADGLDISTTREGLFWMDIDSYLNNFNVTEVN